MIVVVTAKTPTWRVKDVAAYFGVKPSAVYKWVYAGLLTPYKTPGGGLRFVEEEVKVSQSLKREAEILDELRALVDKH